MDTKDNFIPHKKKIKNLYSMIFFIVVMVITGLLISYNLILKNSISSIGEDIQLIENSIIEINKDKNISLYNLININKDILIKLKNRSQIPKFIGHLKKIESKYRINLTGFNYGGGKLSSSVAIANNVESFSYNIAKDFISLYRKDKTNLFDLGFINSIKGNENIKFSVQFKLKD